MIDIKLLREQPEALRVALENRHNPLDLDGVLALDAQRRRQLHAMEQLRAEQNKAMQEIAQLKKAKRDASSAIAAMKDVSGRIKALDDEVKELDTRLRDQLLIIPNVPHETVPVGPDGNRETARRWPIREHSRSSLVAHSDRPRRLRSARRRRCSHRIRTSCRVSRL